PPSCSVLTRAACGPPTRPALPLPRLPLLSRLSLCFSLAGCTSPPIPQLYRIPSCFTPPGSHPGSHPTPALPADHRCSGSSLLHSVSDLTLDSLQATSSTYLSFLPPYRCRCLQIRHNESRCTETLIHRRYLLALTQEQLGRSHCQAQRPRCSPSDC
ncbi:uncharacterized protein BJ171DRAFT_241096, partial [Polychytrium aggregatum]|uniref:uncharacterized protein n=1 Tax=Polychytrium aggregatum TaxID=110093 RepID=UPI0022FF396B